MAWVPVAKAGWPPVCTVFPPAVVGASAPLLPWLAGANAGAVAGPLPGAPAGGLAALAATLGLGGTAPPAPLAEACGASIGALMLAGVGVVALAVAEA